MKHNMVGLLLDLNKKYTFTKKDARVIVQEVDKFFVTTHPIKK